MTTEAGELADHAIAAGPDAPVPSCPEWTVSDLLGHQGMVHRWAAGNLTQAPVSDHAALEQESAAGIPTDPEEQPGWLRSGAADLADVLRSVPEDVPAMVFLRNAPGPRTFWARRQLHETTVHRVDALAARLGTLPTTAQAAIDTDVAVDGLDELLTGFLPRPRAKLRSDVPLTVAVLPTDADVAWTVRVSTDPAVVTSGAPAEADATVTGTAASLYLGLWNRGDEIAQTGPADAIGLWRSLFRVSW
ncbi:maleylpyruvate isomerase family mycothiol-dependent enzyme [Nakamurella sp. YIM 132087]|uniref:Maleylpyruvate isomerase family mycothiol-dependent enzyme n=1 Tax=Nakamurella alba TaxID=2665158 RepID=A0A7K1FPH0_9ACTN|nr:maleylpyruvate isomerase family mycothiol-dependent enzyme [Nakamurella alba]